MSNSQKRNKFFDDLFNTDQLMWLGQNTNHFEPHPRVREAVIRAFDKGEYHAYAPPLGFECLRELILEDIGVSNGSVMVTDGAVQALFSICSQFCSEGTEFLTTDPSWAWPMSFARQAGSTVVQMPIYNRESGYKLSIEQLADHVNENTRVIYLVDPNNPLGTCHTEEEIKAFTDIARSVDAYFIHDITYSSFADKFTPAFHYYPEKTLTTYSFSKWLGLAGMRLGAIIASAENIELLASAPPNNLGSNVLSQRAAITGLQTKQEWFPKIKQRLRRNQQMVYEAVSAIQGLSIPVYPSQGNFVVIETTGAGIRPEALVAVFRDQGIMIRQGSYHTQQFGDRFVKVSLTVPEDWVDKFCRALPQSIEKARNVDAKALLY